MKSIGGVWLGALAALTISTQASAIVEPIQLNPGTFATNLPNGFSSGESIPSTRLFDETLSFTYAGLSGTLRERVISYADAPSLVHPGLYFDYEIQLTTGSIASFLIGGYSGFQTFVKQCGIAGCGGSGANGVGATDAARTLDGGQISFDFGSPLMAGQHSANFQVFTSAAFFRDPLAYFIDTEGNSFAIDIVAPSSVPEPSTLSLLAVVIVAGGFKRRTFRVRPLNSPFS